ncbi:hypothetical protein ACFS07_27310 [Undibacterium arcticum]
MSVLAPSLQAAKPAGPRSRIAAVRCRSPVVAPRGNAHRARHAARTKNVDRKNGRFNTNIQGGMTSMTLMSLIYRRLIIGYPWSISIYRISMLRFR